MSSQGTIPVITEGEFIESLNSMRIPEEKPQIPEDRSGWHKIDLEDCQYAFLKCNTMNPHIERMVLSSAVEDYTSPKKNRNTPKGELIYGDKNILKSNAVNIEINPGSWTVDINSIKKFEHRGRTGVCFALKKGLIESSEVSAALLEFIQKRQYFTKIYKNPLVNNDFSLSINLHYHRGVVNKFIYLDNQELLIQPED